MSRHFFPGGNTPAGFHSFFGNISWGGERMIHLKGASGCGKSTFMKKAAAAFEACGRQTEFFHCSNDAQSLDGVRVPGAGFCIIDGTAPHLSDPAIPIARDEIFNMAAFIDPKAVSGFKEELADLMRLKKQGYGKACNYLAAAWAVYRNNSQIRAQSLDMAQLNAAISETLSVFDGIYHNRRASHRKLFASAITPDGYVNCLDSLINQKNVYVLRGEAGTGTELFLERVRETASLRGLDSEGLYCSMDPGRLEHLIVPALELCFTTKNKYHAAEAPGALEIDFAGFLDHDIAEYREELDSNRALFDTLAKKAIQALAVQRAAHARIEEIYIAGMDFEWLNRACDGLIEKLLREHASGHIAIAGNHS